MALDTGNQEFVLDFTGAPLDVTAGRVSLIDVGTRVLRVLSDPADGNVTVNPDGSLALVLSDPSVRGAMSFTCEVMGDNGPEAMTVALKAVAGAQAGGWGAGNFYMLETDADNHVVVEAGQNHREIYVSGSSDALSLKDIAAIEDIDVGKINGAWLAAHSEYGSHQGEPLDTEAGTMLWYEITGRGAEPGSHWLMFERGYQYDDTGRLTDREAAGESALHPLLIGAWGEGDRPIITDNIKSFQGATQNIVFQGLELTGGMTVLDGKNFILDDLDINSGGLNIQRVDGFTLHDATVTDVIREHSVTPGFWDGSGNKLSGIFINGTDGLLIENVLIDHSGWDDNYDVNGSLEGGQPPSMYSHNVYIQADVSDVTFRDNISMQGASFGAQIRPGGFVEGNVFIDNNVGLLIADGENSTGNYSLVMDNVTTLAGHKDVAFQAGALSGGDVMQGFMTSLIDNLVTHLNDPDDAAGLAEKTVTRPALTVRYETFTDDTIVYDWVTENWRGHRLKDFDQNLPADLSAADLDKITISAFLEKALGVPVAGDGVALLSTWLRANWSNIDAPSDIVAFFQAGFDIAQVAHRDTAATLRFVPDVRGEGFRWDNHLNWSTVDLPGTAEGDRVDLAGNWVTYSGTTAIKTLNFGAGGTLTVNNGYLEVSTRLKVSPDGGDLAIGSSGQFWTHGYADADTLDVTVTGGRFANTGSFRGLANCDVSGGEVILATGGARFDLNGELNISGSDALLGFDGPGGAATLVLRAGSHVSYTADADGLSSIAEFRSGHWGTDQPGVDSKIDLGKGTADLSIDLSALTVSVKTVTYDLATADRLVGGYGHIDLTGIAPTHALLREDFSRDTLTLTVSPSASFDNDFTFQMIGSDAKDSFYIATGVETHISRYARVDVVDLSARLDKGDMASLHFVATTTTDGDLVATIGGKDVVLAEIGSASRLSSVKVMVDGTAATLKVDLKGVAVGAGDSDPTIAERLPHVITGTNGSDVMRGTAGIDVFHSLDGGNDQMWGDAGADIFVFGVETRSGSRGADRIYDFDMAEDTLVFENGTAIQTVQETRDGLKIVFEGDGDSLYLYGNNLNEVGLHIVSTDAAWQG